MNWYLLIFSDQRAHRMQRHLIFWLLWWAYFSLSYFHYSQSGIQNIEFEPWDLPFFIKSMLLLVIHILACYYFIDFLMPRYLFTSRYLPLSVQIFLLSLFVLLANYFLHKEVFPIVNSAFDHTPTVERKHILWTSITSGILSAPKVICAAAAAKLLKRWWLKQKEKELLLREKLITDLQLLKAQIHPEFLFSSLDSISLLAQKKNIDGASTTLLKLADILSYMLYECDNKLVPLAKEIKTIKDYLLLEKIRMGNKLEIDVAIKGEPGVKVIAPLLLFSFIENSFSYISNKNLERNWINLEFQIGTTEFAMKLIHGKTAEPLVLSSNENAIANTIKRLDFYYPGNYELKTTVEPEIMMTYLRVVLEESMNENENKDYIPEQMSYATV